MQRKLILLGLTAFALIGCGQKGSDTIVPPKKGVAETGKTTTPEDAKPEASTPSGHITQEQLDKLPATLKHDGFRYYGFTNLKPIKYRVTVTGRDPLEGEQIVQLKDSKETSAVFEAIGTGNLAEIGTQELTVKPDGVYATGMSLGKIEGTPLQLPADLPVGKSWKSHQKVEMTGGKIFETTQMAKVAKEEKIKVPAGEFDALFVTSKGPGKFGDDEGTMSIDTWYVKDVGAVKVVFSQTTKASKTPQVSTFEMIP